MAKIEMGITLRPGDILLVKHRFDVQEELIKAERTINLNLEEVQSNESAVQHTRKQIGVVRCPKFQDLFKTSFHDGKVALCPMCADFHPVIHQEDR